MGGEHHIPHSFALLAIVFIMMSEQAFVPCLQHLIRRELEASKTTRFKTGKPLKEQDLMSQISPFLFLFLHFKMTMNE